MIKWIGRGAMIILSGAAVYYFLPEKKIPPHKGIDTLVVLKSRRLMQAYSDGRLIKSYKIALGGDPVGDKESDGDMRTPEGVYTINDKNPNSGYYKNLGISYPDKEDVDEAKKRNLDPGGNIKIHGIRNGFGFIGKFHRVMDWTAGCIAVTDEEMDELYAHVKIGVYIIIKP